MSSEDMPLTLFICNMMKVTPEALARADKAALARKYSLPIEWVKFYIDREMARG